MGTHARDLIGEKHEDQMSQNIVYLQLLIFRKKKIKSRSQAADYQ
jgi:hypothetical protein